MVTKTIKSFIILSGMAVIINFSALPLEAQNFADIPEAELEEKSMSSDLDPLEVLMVPSDEVNLPQIPQAGVDEPASKYTLGKMDVLEIAVNRHPEVSGQFVVNNEGKIQYEFVGDVVIEHLTKDEVKSKLQELLAEFIVSPEVTVKIVGYNSKVVYVIGEVGRPGKIFMRGDTITVREALVQAGLPLLSASTKKSKLITPADSGKAKQQKINVYALLFEGDLRENYVMNPGDTLYLPATGLTKVMRAIQPVAAPIGTAAGTGRTVMTGF